MIRLSAILICVLMSGCASITQYQQDKQLLLAPAPLNSPVSKAVIVDSYAVLMQAAQNDSKAIPLWVDAGTAVNTLNCQDWLSRISASKRGLILTDKNISVAEGLGTTLLGVAKAAASTVAVVGALETAYAGFSTNLQTDLLLAPSPYVVQTTLLSMLDSCSSQLHNDAPKLSFSQAYTRLESCSRVCSYEAAAAAATNALSVTTTSVHPVSGALHSVPRAP